LRDDCIREIRRLDGPYRRSTDTLL
jgi:hypothetical protein